MASRKWINQDKVKIKFRPTSVDSCHLIRIEVPPRKRGKGLGTKAMIEFVLDMQSQFKTLTMTALHDSIAEWNHRLGFSSSDNKHFTVNLTTWTPPKGDNNDKPQ